MPKAENKTQRTDASVADFLAAIPDPDRRRDARALAALIRKATGEKPAMWGTSIVGFGTYHYKGASGREGDWMLTGFSPRKQNLTLYLMGGFDMHKDLLKKLGKYKTSVGCLYIKKLDDIDKKVLKQLVTQTVKTMKKYSVK